MMRSACRPRFLMSRRTLAPLYTNAVEKAGSRECDPSHAPSRRLVRSFQNAHGMPPERRFASAEEMLMKPGAADAVIVSPPDRQHSGPAKLALENNCHLLPEKPVPTDTGEVLQLQGAHQ
jgi:predicted dehydrogenase